MSASVLQHCLRRRQARGALTTVERSSKRRRNVPQRSSWGDYYSQTEHCADGHNMSASTTVSYVCDSLWLS